MRREARRVACGAAAFVLSSVAAVVCASAARAASPVADDGGALVGDWVGESLCTKDAPAACRDEKVVYHIKRAPDAEGNVEIVADKIVDGKPEYMGTIRLKYDAEKRTLRGDLETPRYKAVWEFFVRGDTMEGTLTVLPEKNVVRRVSVKKDAAHK
jgi:hypothetical protein